MVQHSAARKVRDFVCQSFALVPLLDRRGRAFRTQAAEPMK